ncbi:hypothetical protein BDN72DRAFT_956503 [Pluteus cervinus]|uniref:Uncharacterized protein n=1 Tax=Pluteus cervinus TaxID=181527 RepID=A0ACD3B929_9AGAR|nr:hypothetical protein BDN72DRAFT_956503 [Pluteus cervinus]
MPAIAAPSPKPAPDPSNIPPADFDAGLNTSNAWTTEHRLTRTLSTSLPTPGANGYASDEEPDLSRATPSGSIHDNDTNGDTNGHSPDGGVEEGEGEDDYGFPEPGEGRPARALYAFEGKPEFRELNVEAGDDLEVLKEEVGDGWSLVRVLAVGEVGLVPKTYYTFTSDFTPAPDLEFPEPPTTGGVLSAYARRKEGSTSSTRTVRGAPLTGSNASTQSIPTTPLLPQNTGEWRNALLPNFRQSLLGGKSLNRFSSFVTSGAEEWVLKGTGSAEAQEEDAALAGAAATTPFGHIRLTSGSSSDSSPFGDSKEGEYGDNLHSPYKFLHSRENTSVSFLNQPAPFAPSIIGPGSQIAEGSNGKSVVPATSEADRHFVDAGPSWKEKLPPFRVMVHSPSKRTSVLTGAYTIYNVTSLFQPNGIPESNEDEEPGEEVKDEYVDHEHPAATRITVQRRFSHFVILHTALTRRLPGIALPPLPEKQYAGRFSDDFVEARRGDLERYIEKIVRHPVARYAEIVTFFLACESELEWKRLLPKHLAIPPAGPAFYARIYHPAFNVDAEDAEEAVERFDVHTKAVGKGVQGLRNIFGRIREARIEMSKAERLLSYSLLSLVTSKTLASAPLSGIQEDEDEDEEHDTKFQKGSMNENGAWCWREDCQACLGMTKALQKTSETLQNIADLYDDHARRTQLATQESLKGMAHPHSLYEPVITTHRSTLTRYREAIAVANGTTTDGRVRVPLLSLPKPIRQLLISDTDTNSNSTTPPSPNSTLVSPANNLLYKNQTNGDKTATNTNTQSNINHTTSHNGNGNGHGRHNGNGIHLNDEHHAQMDARTAAALKHGLSRVLTTNSRLNPSPPLSTFRHIPGLPSFPWKQSSHEEMAARCETVLNTTMAEMDTYHTQKVEDFTTLAKEHLDGEIELYEQILTRLRVARANLDPEALSELGETPRVPSIYERELESPQARLNPKPLMQPCPHVFDSAPMRPVSVAIQEGMGMLLGGSGQSRGSVFGKFW